MGFGVDEVVNLFFLFESKLLFFGAVELPVQKLQSELLACLKEKNRLLLRAPTGSGKSTCVPVMLLDVGMLEGLIVVVQPRRIAARMLARRVAAMRGQRTGEEIGYVVRHDSCRSATTRVVYVTDGLLQRWLHENPSLSGVGAVIFDEFHERRVASDVALARCLDLQDGMRDDLRVVVMSATLEVEGLQEYLEPCALLEAEGRTFPVDISHRGEGASVRKNRNVSSPLSSWERVVNAIKEVISNHSFSETGHMLVFLPGVYEISRCVDAVSSASWSKGWQVCPLYSGLSPEQQDVAVASGGSPRIIVSTNVAETSLTIDGVCTVIDSGLARISNYDPVRGIDTLMLEKISRASADQRAGRAGRTAAGRCIRLWSEADQGKRIAFEQPEIQRVDLAEVVLMLLASGITDVASFRWLNAPEQQALERALGLLNNLGAIDSDKQITAEGERMASFPLHPRYSKLLLAGSEHDCLAEAVFVAAAMQGEEIFLRGKGGRAEFSEPGDITDFAAEWRAFSFARDMRYDVSRCAPSGILARAARELGKAYSQLEKLFSQNGMVLIEPDFDSNQDKLSEIVLLALSDRLAVPMSNATLASRVIGERRGKLDADSVVHKNQSSDAKTPRAFIAAEIREVEGREVTVYLNRCTQVSIDALQRHFSDDFSDGKHAVYDESTRRVVNKHETRFRDLVLVEKEGGEPSLGEAARLLAQRVCNGELKLKNWGRSVDQWVARLSNLTKWMPEMELPGFSEDDKLMVVEEVCQGAKSYKEIKNREIFPILDKWLSPAQKAVLDSYAPVEVKLTNGRRAKVKYALDAEPWIAMKMQHLYDVTDLPNIAEGRVPLLVHILAPNQRPWQVTSDLKGFWERGYPQMKKDLAGRYPKHEWR